MCAHNLVLFRVVILCAELLAGHLALFGKVFRTFHAHIANLTLPILILLVGVLLLAVERFAMTGHGYAASGSTTGSTGASTAFGTDSAATSTGASATGASMNSFTEPSSAVYTIVDILIYLLVKLLEGNVCE